MKVTPLEIRQQQFPLRFRGYDPVAVDMFLDLVAGQLADSVKENAQLCEALARKDQEMQRMREDNDWKKPLMAVQQTRDALIERGQQQAQAVVAEAQLKAQQLLLEAEQQRKALDRNVRELTHQRRQILGELRGLLDQHIALLDTQQREHEEQRSTEG